MSCITENKDVSSAKSFALTERLSVRSKSCKRFSKLPDMPFWVSSKIISCCHTLSNAFEISTKILLTSRPSSKKLYISWVIDNSCLMQESPGFKTRLTWRNEFIFSKKLEHFIKIDFSRIFPQIGSSNTGGTFLSISLPPFSWIETMLPFSNQAEKHQFLCIDWKLFLEVYKLRDHILFFHVRLELGLDLGF